MKLATPPERAAYLDAACAGDPQLRAAVEGLLRAQVRDPDFLELPVASLTATPDTSAATAPAVPPAEAPGVVVAGRYKLLEGLGEDGMGTVWMAQQQEPVKRLVAVKLIKAGMDSKAVLARFEAERQALAPEPAVHPFAYPRPVVLFTPLAKRKLLRIPPRKARPH